MESTKRDAEAMLNRAGGIRLAVRAGSPREHVPFMAGGLALAILGPIRDLGDDSVVGGILIWVGLGVGAALLVGYLRRSRQVRVRPRTPTWLALVLAAWVLAVTGPLPGLVDGTVPFAYTLGYALAAAPLLGWAERLRRTA